MSELVRLALVFSLISVNELGDKTWVATFALSSRYRNATHVLVGVLLALAAASIIGVVLGFSFSLLINRELLELAAGVAFIFIGTISMVEVLRGKEGEDAEIPRDRFSSRSIILSSFILTFLSEMGDKTWFSVLLFASIFSPITVVVGALLAFLTVNGITAFLGKKLGAVISERKVSVFSAFLFILLGFLILFGMI